MLKQGLLFLSESAVAKKVMTGVPFSKAMSSRFVPGETVADLVDAVRVANGEGLKVTANFLGEAVKSRDSAAEAAGAYLELLDRLHRHDLEGGLSLKFTQVGQAIDDAFLRETLTPILEKAREQERFLRFDMESSAYTQRTLDAFELLWAEGWRGIGVVLQSYLHRTAGDVERMIELGARVRLCKGAYAEPADVAFQERNEVDDSFVELMKRLLKDGNYPGIATHDEAMIHATIEFARSEGIAADRFEFQMLYGVRRDLQRRLVKDGYNVRVYVPFGHAWYPYLMRRLAERPANVMFMASSVIKEVLPGS